MRLALAALSALVLILPACRQKKQTGETVLRVLTWNTFNLPTIAGKMGEVNLDEEARGKLVARLMKQSGYDVIALNEVFDETVRDALLEEAKSGPGAFTFIVEKLDGETLEDSGLLLLSRLEPIRFAAESPFPLQHDLDQNGTPADITRCAKQRVWWNGQPDDGEVDSWRPANGGECLIAFHDYRACTFDAVFGAECQSSKGVGYVRLRQRNGQPLDVFWTHMQANAGNYKKARAEQFQELSKFIQFWSPGRVRDSVVMGDLNVNGADIALEEYTKTILTSNDSVLGSLGFQDLWPWPTSAPQQDKGLTYTHRNDHVKVTDPEERLDYVLWRDRDGRKACAQHPRVERRYDAVRPGGSTIDLSDHFGVGMEIRQFARDPMANPEPCSPSRAVKLAGLANGQFEERTDTPGACQWLFVEPGTYTVSNLTGNPMHISAWLHDDISEPLPLFRGDAELGPKEKQDEAQVASDRPFFLKFCWLDPARVGLLRVQVGPNTGADPLHPIVLTLNRFAGGVYGTQFGANPTTVLWTLVQLPETFSGDAHALSAALETGSSTKLRLGWAAVGGGSPVVSWVTSFVPGDGGVNANLGSHGGGSPIELHVVIEREPPAVPSAGFTFKLRAVTHHQQVELGVLECIEQEDSTGDDRVRLTYDADGKKKEIIDLGDFDEGQDTNLSGRADIGRLWVRGPVKITIYDQDGSDLEDDLTSGNALDNLGTDTVPQLSGAVPADAEEKTGMLTFTQDGANYRLRWKRRR